MMYAVILMCFMMTAPWVFAVEDICIKTIKLSPVTEPSCTVYGENYTCEDYGDQLQSDNTCIRDCSDPNSHGYSGQTFQLYNGIDVTCDDDYTDTYNNIEDCMQWCRGDRECLSGSYNSSSGLCINHICDQQGDYASGILPSEYYTALQNLGPCITFFMKNCF